MENKHGAPAHIEPFVRRHRPFFVGLFIFIPVIAMPALLVFAILKDDRFQKWDTLYVVCENSQGLKNGSNVTISGNTIGYVKGIDLIREKEVCVRFDIRGEYSRLVKKDTRARLKQRGFVGDWEVELTGGGAAAPEAGSGDTLKSEKTPTVDGIIEMAIGMIDSATVLLNEFTAMARDINAGDGTVGRLLKDDTLYRHMRQVGLNAIGFTSDLRKVAAGAQGTLGKTDSLLSAFTGVGTSVGAGGTALLDSLMTLVAGVNKSFDDIGLILKDLKAVSGGAPEMMNRLKDDVEEAEAMIRALQSNWLFKKAAGPDASKNPNLTESP
jgi:phospholipid/cholesterol/gamma-HCH transport system substrate-binding protein